MTIDEDAFGAMAGSLSKYGKGIGAEPKTPKRSNFGDQTMTGHIEKKTGSGTVYKKQLPHYGDHKEAPVVERPEGEVKRGRGRPAGKYGSYKPRQGDAAATAAKAAATKAANKAARNESMTEEDYIDICEMHELETFDDLLEFALELDEMQIDELSKSTLGSYIKKASVNAANSRSRELFANTVATNRHKDSERDYLRGRENDAEKHHVDSQLYDKVARDAAKSYVKRDKNINKAVGKLTKESTEMTREEIEALIESYEQLDELSKATLGSYIKKAAQQAQDLNDRSGAHFDKSNKLLNKAETAYNKGNLEKADKHNADSGVEYDTYAKMRNKAKKHTKGLGQAVGKLTKEEVQSFIDDCSNLDEADLLAVLDALRESTNHAALDKSAELSESMSLYVKALGDLTK